MKKAAGALKDIHGKLCVSPPFPSAFLSPPPPRRSPAYAVAPVQIHRRGRQDNVRYPGADTACERSLGGDLDQHICGCRFRRGTSYMGPALLLVVAVANLSIPIHPSGGAQAGAGGARAGGARREAHGGSRTAAPSSGPEQSGRQCVSIRASLYVMMMVLTTDHFPLSSPQSGWRSTTTRRDSSRSYKQHCPPCSPPLPAAVRCNRLQTFLQSLPFGLAFDAPPFRILINCVSTLSPPGSS